MVGARGLEPPILAEPDPKSGVFAISPRAHVLLLTTFNRSRDSHCFLDGDLAFVASHTFPTSICGHVTRGVLWLGLVQGNQEQKGEFVHASLLSYTQSTYRQIFRCL